MKNGILILFVIMKAALAQSFTVNHHSGEQFPEGLRQYAYVLQNHSDKQVIALHVLWTITEPDGSRHVRHDVTDNLLSQSYPVLKGKAALVMVPGLHAPLETSGSKLQGSSESGLRSVQTAASVTMSIDAIIYEDGEIAGPNTQHYDEELLDKVRSARAVVAAMDRHEVLKPKSDWERRLTEMVEGSQGRILLALRNIPELPQIYRKDIY